VASLAASSHIHRLILDTQALTRAIIYLSCRALYIIDYILTVKGFVYIKQTPIYLRLHSFVPAGHMGMRLLQHQ